MEGSTREDNVALQRPNTGEALALNNPPGCTIFLEKPASAGFLLFISKFPPSVFCLTQPLIYTAFSVMLWQRQPFGFTLK
jgi:hypothetical protein